MDAIMLFLVIDTIVQLLACHFSLWWLVCLICRLLFFMRLIGATIPIKKLAIGEGVAFGGMLLWNILFHGGNMPWVKLLLFALLSLIALGLEYLDTRLYLYVIEDLDD